MNHGHSRLENPSRLAELNPKLTLERIGLSPGSVFCDIGAGTGIFTFAASEITTADIYAVDISEDMLEILRKKAKDLSLENINAVNSIEGVLSNSCDVVLLCTVFHELSDTPYMMREIKRVLRENGLLSIIEFHKRSTPMGPPINRRLGSDALRVLLQEFGFEQKENFDLGENFYCSVFCFQE